MKILVLCLSGMGNFILFLPAMAQYRKAYPSARFHFLVRHQYLAELVEHLFGEGSCTVTSSRPSAFPTTLSKLMRLRKARFDLSIVTFPSNRRGVAIAEQIIGAKSRGRFLYPESLKISARNPFAIRAEEGLHDTEQNLRLAQKILGEAFHPGLSRSAVQDLSGREFERGQSRVKDLGSFVVLHPSYNLSEPYKGGIESKVRLFQELAQILHDRFRVAIVLAGGSDERKGLKELAQEMERPALVMTPESILETAGMLRQARLLINVDSGLGHLASLMNVPSITLFGPADPRRTSPVNPNQIVLRKAPAGAETYGYPFSRPRAAIDSACWFEAFRTEEVVEALLDLQHRGMVHFG